MGMQTAPAQLFYDFCLDDHIPEDHLLRRIDRFLDLEKVRRELRPFYSSIGRPSIDPELMMRMLMSATAWVSGPNGGCAGRSISTCPIAGFVTSGQGAGSQQTVANGGEAIICPPQGGNMGSILLGSASFPKRCAPEVAL